MRILVTGSAGFIGSSLVVQLLENGFNVMGIDNHNDYYDPELKEARLSRFKENLNYQHLRIDLSDKSLIDECFKDYQPEIVVNLAAQAGVRYSIENPSTYIESNIVGFLNVLEACRHNEVKHLVYASSSSVYGANTKTPFSVTQNADHPLSLYAATKKSNELMAHSYSHLYKLPTTGLRFFTVYGPWGRPDMALFKFTKAILNDEVIKIFNYGNHMRDFTFIDDIVEGIIRVLKKPSEANASWNGDEPSPSSSLAPWRIYNIGNNNPIKLLDYVDCLEDQLKKKAKKELLPLQDGDVPNTFADIEDLVEDFDYMPKTSIKKGISSFIEWYKNYYKI